MLLHPRHARLSSSAQPSKGYVNRLAEAGDAAAVESILSPLLHGNGVTSDRLVLGLNRTVAYNLGLKAFANAGDIAGAERWHTQMQHSDVCANHKTFGKLAEAASKSGEHIHAERWLERGDAQGFPITRVQASLAVDASSRAGDPHRAQSWAARVDGYFPAPAVAGSTARPSGIARVPTQNSFNDPARNAAVSAWGRGKDLRRAELEISRLLAGGSAMDAQSWHILMDACAKTGDGDRAKLWLFLGQRCNLLPSRALYTSLLDAYASAGDGNSVESLLLRMLSEGFVSDGVVSNVLMKSCTRCGDDVRGERWLSRLHRHGSPMELRSITTLIAACAASGDMERARWWLEQMPNHGLTADVVCCTAVIRGHLRAGDLPAAERLLAKMLKIGPRPNELTFGSVIGALASAFDSDAAERWYLRMLKEIGRSDIYVHNQVVASCARNGDASRAHAWLSRMAACSLSPDAITCNTVLDAYARVAEDGEHDVDAVYASLQTFGVISWPDGLTFSIRMRPGAYAGDPVRVDKVWQELLDFGLQPGANHIWAVLTAFSGCRPPDKVASARRYQQWLDGGGKPDSHVVKVLRRLGIERKTARRVRAHFSDG